MAKKTGSQIAEKYSRGVQGAGNDYLAGVQNPNRSWASATQQGAQRWAAGIQQAIANKSFESGVQRAGDAKWQQAAAGKGARNYVAAAQEATTAYSAVADKVMAAASAAQNAVANMPATNMEQRIARAAAAMRATSAAWGNKSR